MKSKYVMIVSLLYCSSVCAQTFTLRSKDLGGQATARQLLNGFGCKGENKSPQLYWENAPEGTRSFAATMFDEDAPTGSGWWHWVIFDVPNKVTELQASAGNPSSGVAPTGSVQSVTDFKTNDYGGPCPPEGGDFHKYTVTVYALKCDKLGVAASANPALVGFMLQQNLIQKSSLVFYCKR